ncbi:BcABA3 [Pyrenochaeta sp. MPI-SDFR-AT-0127]|nr:BcABA3 [Pyrenochaeta sp. MPI-SDFR-AT-0127]
MAIFRKTPFGFIECLREHIPKNNKTPLGSRPDSNFPEPKVLVINRPNKSDKWYYPSVLANDLQGVDLAWPIKEEVFACAWEYTRCIIPQYTNWKRYIAFARTIVIAIVAEYRGNLVDISAGDYVLGYDLKQILGVLFEGTPAHDVMAREYRSSILISSDKASPRREGELFRRYVNALAKSPRQWFRMRDADALARFTIAAALACNDLNDVWFTDDQFEILTEIGDTLYDAVAFFKHRCEGETNSTFAYVPAGLRAQAFQQCRELLWALDVAWACRPELQCVLNFTRFFGGPIHMMMRRYRFVEDGLTIGRPETKQIITQTRQGVKLWNRVDVAKKKVEELHRYEQIIARKDLLLFPGLASFLQASENERCGECHYRDNYGADIVHKFGGVELCEECKLQWAAFIESLPVRAGNVFPELAGHAAQNL